MINLPGNLYIRSVHGRDGDYSVGRLVTDIGEFVLRDALLGQYEEGHYCQSASKSFQVTASNIFQLRGLVRGSDWSFCAA